MTQEQDVKIKVSDVIKEKYVARLKEIFKEIDSKDYNTLGWTNLVIWNNSEDQLSETDLKSIFNPTLLNASDSDELNIENILDRIKDGKKLKKKQIKELFKSVIIPSSKGRTKTVSYKKEGIIELANYISRKNHFKAIKGPRFYDLYMYQDGIYVNNAGTIPIREDIIKILGKYNSSHIRTEVIENILGINAMDRDDFAEAQGDLICVNNGILNIKTRELIPHDPELVFTSKIPVDYNPKMDCPIIKEFIKDTLYPENIDVIQEWFGFSLLREYKYKMAMIMFGDHDTGKTTLTNLLRDFIGEKNCSSLGLYKLNTNTYACYSMYNKLVNTCDDLGIRDISDNGQFKSATGKGSLQVEQKFQDPFSFVNYAKMLFNCNTIPLLKGALANDKAYFIRWIPVPCDNVLSVDEIDSNLSAKINTPEELSGLLNYALDGLDRLLKNDRFSYDKDWNETKNIMERSGEPLAVFAQDELEEKIGGWISKADMHKTYNHFAYNNKNKLPSLTIKYIGRHLIRYAPYIADLDSRKNNIKGWSNVQFKNPLITPDDSTPTATSAEPGALDLAPAQPKPVFGDPESGKLVETDALVVKK